MRAFLISLAIIAVTAVGMCSFARAYHPMEIQGITLCKKLDDLHRIIDERFVKKQPTFILGDCVFADAVILPVTLIETMRKNGREYQIWEVIVGGQVVDGKTSSFATPQRRFAFRSLPIEGEDA